MGSFFGYFSLIMSQIGITGKQYSMKHCGRLAPGPFNSICINLLRSVICLVVSFCIWIFSDGGTTDFWGHVIIILAGLGTALNLFTWILSSRLVSLTLIEALSMLGSMVVPLILTPYLFNGESVSLLQWIGCALIFVSVFLFMNKSEGPKEGSAFQKIIIVSGCVIGITVTSLFKKYYIFHFTSKGLGSVEYFTFINFVTVLTAFVILFAVYYFLERRKLTATAPTGEKAHVELPYKKVWFYILIASASLYLNELFTVYAAELPAAIYYPLSRGLIVICTFLLDVIVFKDKVTVKKLIGLGVVIVASVLVNL